MIINHDFKDDNFPGGASYFPNGIITGWTCTSFCELMKCYLLANSNNCTGNYIDLDPIGAYQTITQ